MSEKKYNLIRRLFSIIFFIIWFVILSIEVILNLHDNIILLSGFIYIIIKCIATSKLDRYFEKKNNNELYRRLALEYREAKTKYSSIYCTISEYINSEDLQKQLMVKELRCNYQNDSYNITLLSVAIASMVLMVNNFEKVYSVFLYLFNNVFSLNLLSSSNEFFINTSITIFIFIILSGVILKMGLFRFNRYINSVIDEIERDMNDFNVHGESKNSRIVNVIINSKNL